MSKLRHIAMQVPNLEEAANFNDSVFEMERVGEAESPIGNAISLSDGIMNLTLLCFPDGKGGLINSRDWAGLHDFGFVVEDKASTTRKIEEAGGEFFESSDFHQEGASHRCENEEAACFEEEDYE